MSDNMLQQPKRPANADRPFPWHCRHCGQDQVFMTAIRYDADVRHDGRVYAVTIPDLQLPICKVCGEKVFTENVDDQIFTALRTHLHLLTPAEMRAALGRLGMTPKEVAERLGIAETTFSYYLNDIQIQPRATDNLLRVFFAFPEVRSALTREPHDPGLGIADAPDRDSGQSANHPAAELTTV
jgi:hypothetical protein